MVSRGPRFGGRPGPGLLAHVLVSKYADHLPLYRQARIYARDGIDLDRSTLADLVARAEGSLRALGLAYRVVDLCAADLGASSAVGLLVTSREGDGYSNQLAGVDGLYRVDDSSWFRGQYLSSQTEYPAAISGG